MKRISKGREAEVEKDQLRMLSYDFANFLTQLYGLILYKGTPDDQGRPMFKPREMNGERATMPGVYAMIALEGVNKGRLKTG